MDKLKIYYKLCGVKLPKDAPNPLIGQIGDKVEVIFTKKQVSLYIKKDKTGFMVKENIVGGRNSKGSKNKVLVV